MSKMNPEVKAKWLAALRSGEYQQSKERLKCDTGFCCLGVATDLFLKENGVGEWVADGWGGYDFVYKGYPGEGETLPHAVMKWMGLAESNPSVVVIATEDQESLDLGPTYNTDVSELNDGGSTFLEIADIIEAQL